MFNNAQANSIANLYHINRYQYGSPELIKFENTMINTISLSNMNKKRHVTKRSWATKKTCKDCNKIFPNNDDYNLHNMIEHSKDIRVDFYCDICSQSYSEKRWLNRHIKNSHYNCVCQVNIDLQTKTLQYKIMFPNGIPTKQGNIPYAKWYSMKQLNTVKTRKKDSKCGMRFITEKELQNHIKTIHGNNNHVITNNNVESNSYDNNIINNIEMKIDIDSDIEMDKPKKKKRSTTKKSTKKSTKKVAKKTPKKTTKKSVKKKTAKKTTKDKKSKKKKTTKKTTKKASKDKKKSIKLKENSKTARIIKKSTDNSIKNLRKRGLPDLLKI